MRRIVALLGVLFLSQVGIQAQTVAKTAGESGIPVAVTPAATAPPAVEGINPAELLQVKRVYVDRFGGGDTAAQIRDMVISAFFRSGLFQVTENEDKADAFLRGSAEDLVFTDRSESSDSISARASLSTSNPVDKQYETGRDSRSSGVSIGQNDSFRSYERKHEASVAVRLVNRDGDVIWATTQESKGAKFRGASSDVAERILMQLQRDLGKAKQEALAPAPAPAPASAKTKHPSS